MGMVLRREPRITMDNTRKYLMKCSGVMKSGKRKGMMCGCNTITNTFSAKAYCKRHATQAVESVDASCEDDCSICHDKLISDVYKGLKNCGHKFHRKCIMRWVNDMNKRTCPLCRSDIFLMTAIVIL